MLIPDDRFGRVSEIAKAKDIPQAFLAQILPLLANHGVVKSQQGAHGVTSDVSGSAGDEKMRHVWYCDATMEIVHTAGFDSPIGTCHPLLDVNSTA